MEKIEWIAGLVGRVQGGRGWLYIDDGVPVLCWEDWHFEGYPIDHPIWEEENLQNAIEEAKQLLRECGVEL